MNMQTKEKTPAYLKRYFVRVAGFMLVYLAVLPLGIWLHNNGSLPGALAPIFALLCALPICGVFWAIFRLLVETDDEYQRLLFAKQILLGTAVTLAIVTIWEFMEVYEVFASGPRWIGAMWFAGFGIAGGYVRWRA